MSLPARWLAVGAFAALFGSGAASSAPILWVHDSSANLGTVDVANGDVNVVGRMGAAMFDIAFDPAGQLWGVAG